MVAPVAKGIIVATTLLLAAGFAAYENEQVRAWIEAQRRKIAIVLTGHDGNDSDSTRTRERAADEIALELRDEVIRRHRAEIIERAQKDGVAVDLDELDAVERMYEAQQEKEAGSAALRRGSAQSFDEMVGSDGMLRDRDITRGLATGTEAGASPSFWEGLRQRGLQGLSRGASFANPFDDEAQLLYDQELIGAGGEELAGIGRVANTSRTITQEPELGTLVDVHESPYKTDEELETEIEEAIRRSLEENADAQALLALDDDVATINEIESRVPSRTPSMQNSIYQSYYYGGQPPAEPVQADGDPQQQHLGSTASSFHSAISEGEAYGSSTSFFIPSPSTLPLQPSSTTRGADLREVDSDDALTPAGTLTPTTEAGFSADGDSLYGEPSVNLADMLESRLRHDSSTQAHEVDEDSDDFSVVDGTNTPGSWTDVESVDGYDDEEHANDDERQSRLFREGTSSTLR